IQLKFSAVAVDLLDQRTAENMQKRFDIAFGINLAQIFAFDLFLEIIKIKTIPILRHRQPVGHVGIKRLGILNPNPSDGRITHMTNSHISRQSHHISPVENIPDETHVFFQVKLISVKSHNTRGILASMLENGKTVIEVLRHRLIADNANDSAHGGGGKIKKQGNEENIFSSFLYFLVS